MWTWYVSIKKQSSILLLFNWADLSNSLITGQRSGNDALWPPTPAPRLGQKKPYSFCLVHSGCSLSRHSSRGAWSSLSCVPPSCNPVLVQGGRHLERPHTGSLHRAQPARDPRTGAKYINEKVSLDDSSHQIFKSSPVIQVFPEEATDIMNSALPWMNSWPTKSTCPIQCCLMPLNLGVAFLQQQDHENMQKLHKWVTNDRVHRNAHPTYTFRPQLPLECRCGEEMRWG